MVRQQHVSHVFCSTYLFVACLMSNYALLQILNDTLSRIKVRNFILMFLVHGTISGIYWSYDKYNEMSNKGAFTMTNVTVFDV